MTRRSTMRELLARLIDGFRRDRLDRELAEELRFHQQQLERDAVLEGLDGSNARHFARRRLGEVVAHPGGSVRAVVDRVVRPAAHDLRQAWRSMYRSPGFVAAVTVVLGLVIGAAVGLLVAQWGSSAVQSMLMHASEEPLAVFTDARTIVVALLLATVPGLIVAAIPALLAGRRDLTPVLRSAGRGVFSSRIRVRGALLIAQSWARSAPTS